MGFPIKLRKDKIKLSKGTHSEVFAIHVFCDDKQAAEVREALQSIYDNHNDHGFPLE